MDEKPFLEFTIENLKENTIQEIAKFHKSNFDIDKIVDNASDLKYLKEIKKHINGRTARAYQNFVRLFASQVYQDDSPERVMQDFTDLVYKAFTQTFSERVNDRLNAALAPRGRKTAGRKAGRDRRNQ